MANPPRRLSPSTRDTVEFALRRLARAADWTSLVWPRAAVTPAGCYRLAGYHRREAADVRAAVGRAEVLLRVANSYSVL